MKGHYSIGKRLMAALLCFAMVAAYLPAMAIGASAAPATGVVDPPTIDGWHQYFGPDVMSTEYTGGVWTDKSVFASFADYQGEEGVTNFVTPAGNPISDSVKQMLATDPQSFLITLSAITANKTVSGSSSAPLDTMLVLDVSGSMQGNNAVAMVQATNEAIETLLQQNTNNRIGVVLYSGNHSQGNSNTDTASVLLPLGRYTTTNTMSVGENQTIPAYLTISGSGNGQTVSVAPSVNNGNSADSKTVRGGTYIQNGLFQAWGEFEAVTDTKVPQGQVQAGAQRTPVVILMSDGAPTAGTSSYNNVQTSNLGNGTSTNNRIAFMTQLTASWVRNKIGNHYNTTPLFYTLGIGTGTSSEATSVLNPAGSNNTLNTYWERFFSGTTGQNVQITTGRNSWSVYKDDAVTTQNYVDKYWLADNADGLLAAFKQIVDTIVLQSEKHSTLVESEQGADMSGYVTFEDELGEMMEVKAVKGLVIGDMVFTGAEMAKGINSTNMGTVENPTDYGDEFIRTVKERLGITDTAVAQQLVAHAYAAGQLSYTSAVEFSNYIGWYADADGNYLGFWQESDGYSAENAPEGAVYINRSYGYLGAQSDEANASDMMHVVVMIHTRISDGHQSIVYKIPASLIPAVTYNIELEGNDPSSVKSITRDAAEPLCLLVEVGLREDINPINLEDKIAEHVAKGGHAHKNADGTYTFYTNRWGDGDGGEVNYDEPLTHLVTESHFHPALENERYYHVVDTTVYSDANGTVYKGTAAPSGDGYYFARTYYEVVGGVAKLTTKYAPLGAETLKSATQGTDGWIIPAGTPQQLTRFANSKTENTTGTMAYSWNPVVLHDSNGYNSYAFLGNNGSVTMEPAQGIALTKTVTQVVPGAPTEFTFTVTLGQAVAEPVITDTDGNPWTGDATVSGNVITLKLKANETVVISGLPTDITYTVAEAASGYYTASITNATGKITRHSITEVTAVNQPRVYNDLIISKDVLPPEWMADITALENQDFSIRVTITGADANTTYTTSDTVTFVTNDQGTASQVITLKDAQSLTIFNLPEGTAYSVAELNVPDGYTANAPESAPITGTVTSTGDAYAGVTNAYAPGAAEVTINLSGTKTFLTSGGYTVPDNEWPAEGFIMELYLIDPVTGEEKLIKGDIKATAANKSWSAAVALSFDKTGVYNYEIVEKQGTADDITYDGTNGLFQIHVTDDGTGTLKVSQVEAVQGTTDVTAGNGDYTVNKNFTNYKDAGTVSIPVQKVINGSDTISANDFVFGLYDSEGNLIDTVIGNGTFLIAGYGEDFRTAKNYTIREIIPTLENRIVGMTYDSTVYQVSVQWNDTTSTLEATVEGTTNNVAVFTNTYSETVSSPSIDLGGTKTLNGNRSAFIDGESYTVELYRTGADFSIDGLTPVQTRTVSGSNYDFDFDGLTFTQEGVYYYVVKEASGNQPGVTYDTAKYNVTIHVVKAVENNTTVLHATATIHKLGSNDNVAEDALNFVNTYTVTGTEQVTISGTKYLEGRELIAGEFAFGLYEGDSLVQSVENRANGMFSFAPITYTAADLGTHTYTVKEIVPTDKLAGVTYDQNTVYTVVVKVTDNGQGGLDVSKTVNGSANTPITFTNFYQANPTNITISGSKTLFDVDANTYLTLADGQFTFELYDSQEGFHVQGDKRETSNNASGAFSFTLNYTKAGDYYYILREQIGDQAGVEYDASRYLIHVRVSDEGAGRLHSAMFVQHEGVGATNTILFGNRYDAQASSATISGTKVLEGGNLTDGMFSFELYEGGNRIQTVSNVGGTFSFEPIEYTEEGTYTYTVKEVNPAQMGNVHEGVVYDTAAYTVTVTVVDQNGVLQATVSHNAQQLVFINAMEELVTKKEVELKTKPGILIDHQKVEVGDVLVYTISYTNYNSHPTNVTIVDNVPAYTSYVEGSAGNGVYASGTITWTVNNVPAYETIVVSFETKVTAANATVTNKAQVFEGNNTYTTNETSNPVTEDEVKKDVFLASAPTVSIDGKKVSVGDILQYSITYTNADDAVAEVAITDHIPANTTYVEGSANNGGVYAAGKLIWTLTLAGGESKTVTFQVKVDAPDVFIENQATASSGNNVLDTNVVTNHTYEEVGGKDVAVAGQPTVSIDGKQVQVGQILEYTIDYTNTTGAPVDVTITDTVPAHTELYNAGTGTVQGNTITWELQNVQPKETVAVTFQVKVTEPGQTIENQAQIFDGTNKVTNKVTNAVPVKTVDKQTVSVGDKLTYVLSYRNVTGQPAKVVITDTLDSDLVFVEGSAGEGVFADGTITWTFENVPAGEEVTVSFQAVVKSTADQTVSNQAQIVENDVSVVFTNETVTTTKTPALSIRKEQALASGDVTTDKLVVKQGNEVTYVLTITNNGEGDAFDITVADKLPEGLIFVSADNGGLLLGTTVTWKLAKLEAGQSLPLTFKVQVPYVQEDTVWENVAVLSYGNNPDGQDKDVESNEVEIELKVPVTPETGDNFHASIFVVLMILSCFGITAVMICKKRDEAMEEAE